MATRKRASATVEPASSDSNPRLELAKAINALSQKMEAFNKANDGLAAFTKDTLVDFDMQVEAKNQELGRLTEETEHTKKRLKTETDLFLAEYRYEGAKKILGERNELPIATAELQALRDKLQKLTSEREAEIVEITKREKASAEKALHSAVQMNDLKHKAQTAQLTAKVEQQLKEIQSLEHTIQNLKEEVAAQRKLTESVANAGRQAPITLQTNK